MGGQSNNSNIKRDRALIGVLLARQRRPRA
jgi:hypothetical protein